MGLKRYSICLFFLLLCIMGKAQTAVKDVTLLQGKLSINVPVDFKEMSDRDFSLRYRMSKKPILILTDERQQLNLIVENTKALCTREQFNSYLDFQLDSYKKEVPDLVVLEKGIINSASGVPVGFMKLNFKSGEHLIFNYFFFTTVNDELIIFTVNFLDVLRIRYEKAIDDVLTSVKVNT